MKEWEREGGREQNPEDRHRPDKSNIKSSKEKSNFPKMAAQMDQIKWVRQSENVLRPHNTNFKNAIITESAPRCPMSFSSFGDEVCWPQFQNASEDWGSSTFWSGRGEHSRSLNRTNLMSSNETELLWCNLLQSSDHLVSSNLNEQV